MRVSLSTVKAVLLVAVPCIVQTRSAWTTGTWTSGYWDCCKPSCAWPNKGIVNQPARSCHKTTGLTLTNSNEVDVCHGGVAASCSDNQPFLINNGLSMGFAAAAVGGVSGLEGDRNCGQCFELQFTDQVHVDGGGHQWGGAHPDLAGKTHIVQVTNIGYDVSGVHSFDLQIPGAGMGAFTAGCSAQHPNFPSNAFDGGNHYGGFSARSECSVMPPELQQGCEWRFDWYRWLISGRKTNNPYVQFRRVKCPSQLVAVSGFSASDDDSYPTINPDDYGGDNPVTRSTTTITTVSPLTTTQNAGDCSPNHQDCRTTRCCIDGARTCYEKDEWWASCRASCTPGINPEDPPQFQSPWTCTNLEIASTTATIATTVASTTTTTTAVSSSTSAVLSTTTSTLAVRSTTTTTSFASLLTTTQKQCSGSHQDCRSTRCCSNPALTCYEKNQWWASCRATCTPGMIDPLDPLQYRTPWSCANLEVATTSTSIAPCDEGGSVWEALADGHSCGSRIQWVLQNWYPGDLLASKAHVASEYPSICGACASQEEGSSRRLKAAWSGRPQMEQVASQERLRATLHGSVFV